MDKAVVRIYAQKRQIVIIGMQQHSSLVLREYWLCVLF